MHIVFSLCKDNPSSPRKTLKMCKVKLLVESFLRRSNICGFETNNYDTKKYSIYQRFRARGGGVVGRGSRASNLYMGNIFFFSD